MAASPSRQLHPVYIYILLFYSLKPPVTTGLYFKLISGTDTEISVGSAAPFTNQEFFECGMQQSCTHVIKVGSGFVTVHGMDELGIRKHEAEIVYEKMQLIARSCLDFYNDGMRENGQYDIFDTNGIPFQVFCDFESEENSVWTLVVSYSLENKALHYSPLYNDNPRKEANINWVDYRLGLPRMQGIRSSSTMWRVTCSFSKYKSDIYRDYLRVELLQVDILKFKAWFKCRIVEYINIRGHVGRNISTPLWHSDGISFHIDSSTQACTFDARQGSISDEDNFGYYGTVNNAFRCSEDAQSTTQFWFGTKV